jgi:hypothetical protein
MGVNGRKHLFNGLREDKGFCDWLSPRSGAHSGKWCLVRRTFVLPSVDSAKVLLKTLWYWYPRELGALNKSITSYDT